MWVDHLFKDLALLIEHVSVSVCINCNLHNVVLLGIKSLTKCDKVMMTTCILFNIGYAIAIKFLANRGECQRFWSTVMILICSRKSASIAVHAPVYVGALGHCILECILFIFSGFLVFCFASNGDELHYFVYRARL